MQTRKITVDKIHAMVYEFHKAFGHPIMADPNMDHHKLRHALLAEEVKELGESSDVIAILDALCDIEYVLAGAWLAFGMIHLRDEALDEVHRSNMSKLGADGKPIYREDGKILKGPNYSPPDLLRVIATNRETGIE